MKYRALFLLITLLGTTNMVVAETINHTVSEGESLYSIAKSYSVPLSQLYTANNLKESSFIKTGQSLTIPLKEGKYTVQPGDNLYKIAEKTGIELKKLQQLNRRSDTLVKAGEVLILGREAEAGGVIYTVEPGDTLSYISLLYNISVDQIKSVNNLNNSSIAVGQTLNIVPDSLSPSSLKPSEEEKEKEAMFHSVAKGETLWGISRLYNIPVDLLVSSNRLNSDNPLIKEGERLAIPLFATESIASSSQRESTQGTESLSEKRLASLIAPQLASPSAEEFLKKSLIFGSESYTYFEPKREFQPNPYYEERDLENIEVNYRKAAKLFLDFEKEVNAMPPLGSQLKGYYIVIDPGHGGYDPGAIVESTDGLGKKVYVVEDEYVYDISIRLYVVLKRYGANVKMTTLSPNHTIRNDPPQITFTNQKNEVYNLSTYNRKNSAMHWPVGTKSGLEKRKEIAKLFFTRVAKEKRIFVSIHADYSPHGVEGKMVIYHPEAESESKELAEALMPHLGRGSVVRKQPPLLVLNSNPAPAAVLIETRNLFYSRNVWAIRDPNLRQQDAEMIVSGIIHYAEEKESR